ncbi:MAG: ribosomal L7Ae/L30e/S12e/Gadd45 family protein [Firmicutes bacterium]|nr:ribosomal L7Ae/L30e/S12e/Gadd45 family protein [Bacillota bacterium]
MPQRLTTASARAVGTRQTLRALEKGAAEIVFVARDAEERVTRPVIEMCRKNGVQVVYVDNMRLLGQYCMINVGAATAAILRQEPPRKSRASG